MEKKIFTGIQLLTGLMLVIFGANKFLGFMSMSPPPPAMGAFMTALFDTGYLMKIVAVVEIVAGLAFLINKYVALMAVVLLPVMLNAFLAHLFLAPGGIAASALLTLFTIVIMYAHKERYSALLKAD